MKTNPVTQMIRVLSLFLLWGYHHQAAAQNNIGIHGQYGMSDVEVNGLGVLDLVDPWIKPIHQFTAGLTYERELGRQVSVLTGAQYASRGFGMREDFNIQVFGLDLPVGARIDTRLEYLEVPLQLKYKIGHGGVSPYVKGGLSAGYALSGKIQPKVDALISWKLPAININLENDLYNRFDLSALAGAGISIPTNDIGSIQLEINYRHSLNDMFLDNITDVRIKTNGWTAGIGYSIRF